MSISGWRITGLTAAVLTLIAAAIWLRAGFTEEGVRSMVRATARLSLLLFLCAFSAASARALFPSAATRCLADNRRYLGVSFALSHFTHLAALLLLAAKFPHPFMDDLQRGTLIGGGLAYVLIGLMTITSFAAPRRLVGERAWKVLHTIGAYYIWLIFLNSYASRAMHEAGYGVLVAALLLVLALRIVWWSRRRASAMTPA